MKDFKQKADNAVFVASAIGPWGILMVIVGIVGLVKCCVMKPTIPTMTIRIPQGPMADATNTALSAFCRIFFILSNRE